jgi:hypothetical protein
VDDPVPNPSRQPRRGPSPEPTNSLQPGLQAKRQVPELTISFTSPNTHPKTDTPEDPPRATVTTTHTVTETPYKRYKPLNFEGPRNSQRYLARFARRYLARLQSPARAPSGKAQWAAGADCYNAVADALRVGYRHLDVATAPSRGAQRVDREIPLEPLWTTNWKRPNMTAQAL